VKQLTHSLRVDGFHCLHLIGAEALSSLVMTDDCLVVVAAVGHGRTRFRSHKQPIRRIARSRYSALPKLVCRSGTLLRILQ
jgi:hypothetical protein